MTTTPDLCALRDCDAPATTCVEHVRERRTQGKYRAAKTLRVCERHATELRAHNPRLAGTSARPAREPQAEQLTLVDVPPSCAFCGAHSGPFELVTVNTGVRRQVCADCAERLGG